MPVGIIFIKHHEIRGPEIKYSYFEHPIDINQEFISQLYLSHAGFGSSFDILDMKFGSYIVKSVFTGDFDRRTNKEAILGFIFKENENTGNLNLFIIRSLLYILNYENENSLELLYTNKLLNYLNLMNLLDQYTLEKMPEIFLLLGDEKYKACLLKLGSNNATLENLGIYYKKILKSEEINGFRYIRIGFKQDVNTFLLVRIKSSDKIYDKILTLILPYLERHFYYSLEIIALFFIPHLITINKFEDSDESTKDSKDRVVFNILKDADNYYLKFREIVSNISREILLLRPKHA